MRDVPTCAAMAARVCYAAVRVCSRIAAIDGAVRLYQLPTVYWLGECQFQRDGRGGVGWVWGMVSSEARAFAIGGVGWGLLATGLDAWRVLCAGFVARGPC